MDVLFERYIQTLGRRRRTPATIRSARSALAGLDGWLKETCLDAATLDSLACERFFEDQLDRYAVSTVHHRLSTIRAAYRYSLRQGLIRHDPTLDVVLPAIPDREPVTFSREDLRAMLAGVRSDQEEMLFFVLAFTGLRLAEANGLRWDQIDYEHDQIGLVGKGGKFRLVPIHPALRHALDRYQAGRPGMQHVFSGKRGVVLSRTTLNGIVADLTSRAPSLRPTSHTFRRTVASELYEQGVRRRVIEKIMGWAPRTIADRHYIRVADQAMRNAILTLYRDDPISPRTPEAHQPVRNPPSAVPYALADDLARLEQLESKQLAGHQEHSAQTSIARS